MIEHLPKTLTLAAALALAGCKTASPAPTCLSWRCADGALQLEAPAATRLSGRFRPADGSAAVRFRVEALPDGETEPKGRAEARYELEGGNKPLVVRLTGPEQATLKWGEVEMDGNGALSDREAAALSDLAQSPIAAALSAVPLALGCREDVRDAALAALLVPWQMLFKYEGGTTPDARAAAIRALGSRSACGYFKDLSPAGPLRLSNESPFPNVFGYFPFDGAGSADEAASGKKP